MNCQACNTPLTSPVYIGRAAVCRECLPTVRSILEKARENGQRREALGVCREMARATFPTVNFPIIRDFPEDVYNALREAASKRRETIREYVIRTISEAVSK